MKKNYTTLILITSIFTVIVMVLIFVFFFKTIETKNENTSKILTTLTNKINDKSNAEVLIKKFSELKSTEGILTNYFIDSTQIDVFVGYLEKIGVDNNTEFVVKSVEISKQEKNDILFKVSVGGNFSNVMKVVYLLENIPYQINLTQVFLNKDIRIEETEIKGVKKQIESSIWTADVSFSILSLSQK